MTPAADLLLTAAQLAAGLLLILAIAALVQYLAERVQADHIVDHHTSTFAADYITGRDDHRTDVRRDLRRARNRKARA